MKKNNEKIIDYYSATMATYASVWYTPSSLALHFGYYDNNTKTHAASLVKINDILSSMAGVCAEDAVLDAGCGVGGSAIWLAKHKKCKVTGININSSQLRKARNYAVDNKVADLVSFHEQDYTATAFADKSFNVVWAQESFSHSDKKEAFMDEAFRLLKDNGRLILAEYVITDACTFTKKQTIIYKKWMDGHAISGLLTKNDYIRILNQAGFRKIEFTDISKNVQPSLRRLYRMAKIYLPLVNIFFTLKLDKIIAKKSFWQLKNIEASYNQYVAFRQGMWNYKIIVAYKI